MAFDMKVHQARVAAGKAAQKKMAEDTSGFHVFAVDPPYAAATIGRKIYNRITDVGQQMTEGTIKNWDEYQRMLGRIEGLREAFALCQDADKQVANERRASLNAR